MPSVQCVACGVNGVFVVWSLLWAWAVFGCIKADNTSWLTAFLVIFYLWTMEVMKGIVFVVTSRCVASWYQGMTDNDGYPTYPGELDEASGSYINPVRNALNTACTTSFGSICFGALLVALFEAIDFVIESMRIVVQDYAFCRCCVGCIKCTTDLVASCLNDFNKHAYVFVAVDQTDFLDSSAKVKKLFDESYLKPLIADDLVGGILIFGEVVVGLVVGILVAIWAWSASDSTHGMYIGFLGLLIGFAMAVVAMAILEAGVASMYIMYALDPDKLFGADESWRFRMLYNSISERHSLLAQKHLGFGEDGLPEQYRRGVFTNVGVGDNDLSTPGTDGEDKVVVDAEETETPLSPPSRSAEDTPAPPQEGAVGGV
jgi:hypothetical protein